jgi:hypothetical protein
MNSRSLATRRKPVSQGLPTRSDMVPEVLPCRREGETSNGPQRVAAAMRRSRPRPLGTVGEVGKSEDWSS